MKALQLLIDCICFWIFVVLVNVKSTDDRAGCRFIGYARWGNFWDILSIKS
jgi:hypothetical protein